MEKAREGFEQALFRVIDTLERGIAQGSTIALVSHYDADGLCSVSIIARMLSEEGVYFQIKIVEQITPLTIDELKQLSADIFIFTDLGSGSKELLKSLIKQAKLIVILDHHQPSSGGDGEFVEVNPHYYGINGSCEVSASGIAYMVARKFKEDLAPLCTLAIVGALGDRQDVGARFSLIGLNRRILEEAKRLRLVEEEIGLRLYGLRQRPLVKALAYTMDPFIPGITGNETASFNFLKSIGINPVKDSELRLASDLSPEEVRKLATALVKYMLKQGLPANEAERIFGMNYYILTESSTSPLRDAREFAQILNACGRLGYYGTGIGLCIGRRGAYLVRAIDHVSEYRRILASVLDRIRKEREQIAKVYSGIIYINLGDVVNERITGAIASLLSSSRSFKGEGKVLLVAAKMRGGMLKISARKIDEENGVNLGVVLEEAAKAVGGFGGGHANAGGAAIPEKALSKFVEALKIRIKHQVS